VTAPAPPIRAGHVSKRFAKVVALDDVTLEVGRGEIFGLLGPNGAGKTTLIRTILDIIKPDSGRLEVFGKRFEPADRDRIGYLPEERGLYPRQPVGAVLEYMGALKGMSRAAAKSEAARWLERLGLAEAATRKVEQLSKGSQQKVQIASTLLARPEIVILDEPLSGLDPVSARLVTGIIKECAASGQTVVLSTHQMGMVESLCTRIVMIARGRVVLEGALQDVKQRYSENAIRVQSTSTYQGCPHVDRIDGTPSAAGFVDVTLRPPATGDDFLRWLVTSGARVEHFERLSTPLEEIFVRVATEFV
jgi:ABC-2 type transport system ATP-binding protein